MSGINKVILVGRLGKDPETGATNGGKKWANMSIATSKKIKSEEKTQWHIVKVWGDSTVDYLKNYAVKGSLIYIEGELETRKYEKDGSDRYVTEVIVGQFNAQVQILTDFKQKEEGKSTSSRRKKNDYAEQSGSSYDADDIDDEIPF